jgi:hypothetical protein
MTKAAISLFSYPCQENRPNGIDHSPLTSTLLFFFWVFQDKLQVAKHYSGAV